ncbi:FAD-binding oxidoreductase [Streptomyces pluripotens]|uniref:FAD-binding oxidoreductase n=1 Tax=Streptomyces pluripotens TaxID=1355015 RepID=A0A221NZC1_9ACTN|nr:MULTISPECIES: FAD-binding oxidoreductase [Streptomyces]ARP71061.1 oxidoreductase [Streptomyces pluripotens]ASN25310.1 FAD-binding oxidoreductase [Streptomyces pluripotens]KIE25946.1 oxidoreductase [Streptomyces sp. MUSC 125]MCH0557168.1 FAD-binding oxidoreductase [Streptomyces sp. MUM 16J]
MSGFDDTALQNLRETLRGPLLSPRDPGYDEARSIYNAMIDRRPAAIAQCVDVGDVRATVTAAREAGVELAVRGGGHSGPGLCLVEDGLTLDLSPMRWVHVDPAAGIARVGGGSQLGDLDHAAHAFGLGVPAGIMSTTGVGGLTLGGGHGHLTRRYGLTVDNLLSADVVLADGSFASASAEENADLFWALRGGGGNFGVVTSFTYRLHPVDTVGVAVTVWPLDHTREVLQWYRDFLPGAPDDLSGFFALLVIPPGPPFPEPIHGQKMCAVVWCYTGDLGGDRLEQRLSAVNDPAPTAFHFTAPMPYPALQAMFDPLIPKGLQWYWRGDFFDAIPDEAIAVHERYGQSIPTGLSTMHMYPVNGAAHRAGAGDTAWSYRDAVWSSVIGGIDPDPANAGLIRQWCVDYWTDLHPHSMGGSYINFLGEGEGPDRVRTTYRDNYDRLAAVKHTYDPDNFFHANQNIPPAAG